MSRPDLVLWMAFYPIQTVLAGVLAGLALYLVARPRPTQGCSDLRVEAWRLYAIGAAIPAFFLGAELILWARLFAWRAPLVFTGLPRGLGLQLLVLAPIPLIALWTWRSGAGEALRHPTPGRMRGLAALLAVAGITLFIGAGFARERAWNQLLARVATEPASLSTLVRLKSYRFARAAETLAALDAAGLGARGAVALAETEDRWLDAALRAELAARIEAGLAAGPGTGGAGDAASGGAGGAAAGGDWPGAAAIPALWRLTEDPARTLRAFAYLEEPPEPAPAEGAAALQALAARALARPSTELDPTLLAATEAAFRGEPLDPALVDALLGHLDDPEPLGSTAMGLLLADGSERGLRPILPRFAGNPARPDALPTTPAWTALRAQCMQRTSALVRLASDPDPAVASGAQAVRSYVQQYCRRARPAG